MSNLAVFSNNHPFGIFSSIKLKSILFSLFIMSYANSSELIEEKYDVLLAGGGLKTCSSMASKNCRENLFSDQYKNQILYQFSDKAIKKFTETRAFLHLSEKERVKINNVIVNVYATLAGQLVNRSALREGFDQAGHLTFYRELADPLYYALLDSLEVAQVNKDGQRKREVTSLAQNRNRSLLEIYQQFVAQSRLRIKGEHDKPVIAVVTASSRDPFEVADFYESVFTDAGAEVVWLPLDKTYRQARELVEKGFDGCSKLSALRAGNLSYYREDIYPARTTLQREMCLEPEKMLTRLASAQGIFFNGGDQSLTLAALKNADGSDSAELGLIRKLVSKGEMIVGGTSAGTAVQGGGALGGKPVPMITNGDSEQAMIRGAFATPPPSQRCAQDVACGNGVMANDLTYRAQGGTGLFYLGLLDTHFSERDRETRLAMFVHTTSQRFGFGVDEGTALMVGRSADGQFAKLSVVGENGVFIVDTHPGQLSEFKGVTPASGFSKVLSGVSHYLNNGSKAQVALSTLTWSFDLAGIKLNNQNSLEPLESGVWRDETRRQCGSEEEFGWQQFGNVYRLKASAATEFYYQKETNHCSYRDLPFVIAYAKSDENL